MHLIHHWLQHLPADVIGLARVLQIQAVRLLTLFIGAHRHNGLSPPLGAGNIPAGAEEHSIAVLGRNFVEELAESLVALAAVADIIGHAGGTWGDVCRPVLLAGIIEVASLGCIQAVVPFGNMLHCKAEKDRCDNILNSGSAYWDLAIHLVMQATLESEEFQSQLLNDFLTRRTCLECKQKSPQKHTSPYLPQDV